YFVVLRRVDAAAARAPAADSSYRKAIEFALRELSGRDPNRDPNWLAERQNVATPLPDTRLADIAQLVSLQTDPKALIALKAKEFPHPLLATPKDELGGVIKSMQETHGATATRTALIAYLDPLTRKGDAAAKAKAQRLLSVVVSNTPDADL